MADPDPLKPGYIEPRQSWPREATPCDLVPAWAGEFVSFEDWVSFATQRLTGTYDPMMGAEIPSVCIDAIGRRCTMGGHFRRAKEEGTFPVRYFFDMRPAAPGQADERVVQEMTYANAQRDLAARLWAALKPFAEVARRAAEEAEREEEEPLNPNDQVHLMILGVGDLGDISVKAFLDAALAMAPA